MIDIERIDGKFIISGDISELVLAVTKSGELWHYELDDEAAMDMSEYIATSIMDKHVVEQELAQGDADAEMATVECKARFE